MVLYMARTSQIALGGIGIVNGESVLYYIDLGLGDDY